MKAIKPRGSGPFVDAKPWSDWLNRRYDALLSEDKGEQAGDAPTGSDILGPSVKLALEIGLIGRTDPKRTQDAAVRRLYRYRNLVGEMMDGYGPDGRRKQVVGRIEQLPRQTVEDACHRFHPDLFYELYPQYAHERDVMLEPDAYCPHCDEWVTPIDGLCPWCTCEHGHLFREVGFTEGGFACLGCAKKEEAEKRQAYAERKRAERKAA